MQRILLIILAIVLCCLNDQVLTEKPVKSIRRSIHRYRRQNDFDENEQEAEEPPGPTMIKIGEKNVHKIK